MFCGTQQPFHDFYILTKKCFPFGKKKEHVLRKKSMVFPHTLKKSWITYKFHKPIKSIFKIFGKFSSTAHGAQSDRFTTFSLEGKKCLQCKRFRNVSPISSSGSAWDSLRNQRKCSEGNNKNGGDVVNTVAM